MHRLVANANLACICMIDAENHPGDLGAPGSHQPGKPKNLAPP